MTTSGRRRGTPPVLCLSSTPCRRLRSCHTPPPGRLRQVGDCDIPPVRPNLRHGKLRHQPVRPNLRHPETGADTNVPLPAHLQNNEIFPVGTSIMCTRSPGTIVPGRVWFCLVSIPFRSTVSTAPGRVVGHNEDGTYRVEYQVDGNFLTSKARSGTHLICAACTRRTPPREIETCGRLRRPSCAAQLATWKVRHRPVLPKLRRRNCPRGGR